MRTRRLSHGLLALASLVAVFLMVGLLGQNTLARGNAAPSNAATSGRTINVGGHGELTLTPDTASLTVGVQSKAGEAQVALSANAEKMAAVLAAVKGLGIPASRIRTTNLSIWYDSQHSDYVVSNEALIRLDDVNKVGSVLDAAVNAGANNSWGVQFGVKDPAAARAQALQTAVADARKRADAMATAMGVTISGVSTASEANYSGPLPAAYAGVKAGAPSAATPVQPGELTVSADVNVTYSFG